MKIKISGRSRLILLLSAFVSLASFLTTGAPTVGAKEKPFIPLLGSPWALENPGKLPYDQCYLEEELKDIGAAGKNGVGLNEADFLFVSSSSRKDSLSDIYLTCSSSKLGILYKIPVFLNTSFKTFGILAALGPFQGTTYFKLGAINTKTVDQTFGFYKGFEIGAGLFVFGGSRSFLVNSSRVQLKTKVLSFGDFFKLKNAKFGIMPREFVKIADCNNPYIILDRDTQSLPNAETRCATGGPFSPEAGVAKDLVNDSKNLQFVKVKR